MLTKVIKIDDQEFTIAQLNLDQVEDIMYGDKPELDDAKGWRDRSWKTVLGSLNNTFMNSSGDIPPETTLITAGSISRRVTLGGFQTLHTEILRFSGLMPVTVGENQPSPAALTSGTSETDLLAQVSSQNLQ